MKYTKKQQMFINNLFVLLKTNNLVIEYNQTFKKKVMLQELQNKFSTIKTKFDYHLYLSCVKHNDGYMSEKNMFSEELITSEMVSEIKTLFNLRHLDKDSKNISYVLCLLKKIKIHSNFIGFINKNVHRIEAKYCIHRDRTLNNYSIFGF